MVYIEKFNVLNHISTQFKALDQCILLYSQLITSACGFINYACVVTLASGSKIACMNSTCNYNLEVFGRCRYIQ